MKYILLVVLLFVFFAGWGQEGEFSVQIKGVEQSDRKLFKSVKGENLNTELQRVVTRCIKEGYLSAGVDTIQVDSVNKKIDVYFYKGKRFKWGALYIPEQAREVVNAIGYGERIFQNEPVTPKEIHKLMEKSLSYLENNGYPFARVKLDSIEIDEKGVFYARLNIRRFDKITIDSVIIKTKDRIDAEVIYNIIRLKPKDIYNQKVLNEISGRIKEITFLSEEKPAEYEFINDKCNVYLYLKRIPSNHFNGILGVQPDAQGKITLTGDVRVNLLNSFYKGEKLLFHWQKLQALTQSLDLSFSYPYLFKSRLGTDSRLHIYKRDTSYIDANFRLGIDYLSSGINKWGVFYENKNSSLLSVKKYEQVTSLPEFADVSKHNYGIRLIHKKIDYLFNPRKGISVEFQGVVGMKTIKKNAGLPQEIYDGIELNTTNYSGEMEVQYFIPIKNRSVVMARIKSASVYNPLLFLNEMYRIGGIRTIRGFDQESIFASSFAISTLEYRFILEKNANLYGFYDYGWYENNQQSQYLSGKLYSFGVGINFETPSGIFALSYALGSQNDAPLYVRAAKIHFGFVSLF